uniref:Outer capsid glycoprotein VP7 n=1 Tax=Maypo virus TaxID=2776959 RepID=A0A8E4VPW6_9REOV|nr:MAG: viral structural protein 7 [Maypo virus]
MDQIFEVIRHIPEPLAVALLVCFATVTSLLITKMQNVAFICILTYVLTQYTSATLIDAEGEVATSPPLENEFPYVCVFVNSNTTDGYKANSELGEDETWKYAFDTWLVQNNIPPSRVAIIDYTEIWNMHKKSVNYCDLKIIAYRCPENDRLDDDLFDYLNNFESCVRVNEERLIYDPPNDERFYAINLKNGDTNKRQNLLICQLDSQTNAGVACNAQEPKTWRSVYTEEKSVAKVRFADGFNLNFTCCKNNECNLDATGHGDKFDSCESGELIRCNPQGTKNVYIYTAGCKHSSSELVYMRVNWKKWWDVFYQIVTIINSLVNTRILISPRGEL